MTDQELEYVEAELRDLAVTLDNLRSLVGSADDYSAVSAIYLETTKAETLIAELRYLAECKCDGMLKSRHWRQV